MSEQDTMGLEIENLLKKYAIDDEARYAVAPHVARVSLEMNHLYQDLGFKNRIEMGQFMKRHFPRLAEMKPKEKLWKKFLYDSIGRVAPACAHCHDQESCFTCLIAEASA